MKEIIRIAAVFAALMMTHLSYGSGKEDPEGYVTYSLPTTVILVEAEAVQETFYAGPYARYAEKYLGIKVRQKDETRCQLTSVSMTPYVEADQSMRYSVKASKGKIDASFAKLSSAGLISLSDAPYSEGVRWRFPVEKEGDFSDKGVSSNLTSASTTLYGKNSKESRNDKVSVQQDMIVAKTIEKKAAETADMILKLRKQRLQIVTGDTDATYSGEAMQAAISEITRLEKEYMTLFTGYSETQVQTMTFDIIPEPEKESQMYVAFRISDSAGLVPADNLSGKPVVMEIVPQEIKEVEIPVDSAAVKAAPKKKAKVKEQPVDIFYRIPSMCTVKLLDGVDILLQCRMPLYQLGTRSSLPANVIL